MANPAPVGPPAKKPKPAPPKPVQVVYLYCENPKCAFHATHVIKSKAEADTLDLVCPLTAPDKLVKIELTTVAPIPATAPAAPATGIVLPTAPYGGFMLMFQDDDEASTWERAKQTDPRHDGARYVAELRRDLLRLAFYSATRIGQEPAGKVTMPLVANVLDLKRHLTKFYSVPSSDKLADVKASAATGTGPIYFRSLLNPAEVYNLFRAWEKTLVGGISADRKLADFGKEWAKRSRAGQTDAALKQLRTDLATSRTTLTNLRARGVALKKEADALKSEVAAAKAKRATIRPVHTGSATDDANDLDGKLKDLDTRIGDAQKRVKDLESELDTLNKTIADLDKKIRAMDPAVTKLEKAIATNLEIYLLLRAALGQIKEEADTATADAKALALAPPAQFAWPLPPSNVNLQGEKKIAITAIDGWLSAPPPPGKPGVLPRLPQVAAELDADWTTPPTVAPPESWDDFKQVLAGLGPSVAAFEAALKASDASTLFDNYRQELREFGSVDQATARYIRQMLTTGTLNGVPVFFNPMDSEIETFDVSDIRTVIGDLVNELGKRAGGVVRTRTNVPIDLLEFIFGHESGKNHTMKWGGRRFVILGIDWANKGDKSNFGERETSAKQLSFSRGWGITGLTKFENAETLPDENGANRAYNFHSGIPYVAAGPSQSTPKFIKSAKENLKNGIALFLDNFNSATQRVQDCTFKTPYDCKECAKAFPPTPLGDVKPDPKDPTKRIFVLKRKVSAVMFDDANTDFVRHFIGKGSLVSYAMRSAEELADLLTRGEHKLPGIDTTQPVLLQLVASDLLEFPCSWITAVLRYAGAGDQAYWYALQALWEVAGKPAPARPVFI